MAAQASVTQLVDQIEDPVTQRAMFALLTAIQLDLATLYAVHNAHIHVAAGALGTGTTPATTTTPSGQLGNLNTVK